MQNTNRRQTDGEKATPTFTMAWTYRFKVSALGAGDSDIESRPCQAKDLDFSIKIGILAAAHQVPDIRV